MIPNASTQLSVAMVANNIGRTETGIVAENSTGVLHRAVTNHKFNQIFLRRMNNSNTEQIFTRNSSCIFAIKEYVAESLGCSKQYMPQKIHGNVIEVSFWSRIHQKAITRSITFAQYWRCCCQVAYRPRVVAKKLGCRQTFRVMWFKDSFWYRWLQARNIKSVHCALLREHWPKLQPAIATFFVWQICLQLKIATTLETNQINQMWCKSWQYLNHLPHKLSDVN